MNAESSPLNRRILIVDDTAAIHADFRKLLGAGPETASDLAAAAAAFLGTTPAPEAAEAFELASAHQGEEALHLVQEAMAQSRPFALAFMDVRMPPGWDGIETTARLWQVDPELQVVLCTAYSDYSWEDIVGRLGSSDRLLILKKPFDRMEVLQLAKTLSEKWRLTRQWNRRMENLDRLVEQRTQELRLANQNLQVEIRGREQTEVRLSAFAALGQRLNAARTVKAAGQLIVEVADQLLGWDACLLDLYSPAQDILSHVLNADLVNGQRTEVEPRHNHRPPASLARRALAQGAQLVLRATPAAMRPDTIPFGDTARPSASLMFVPIRDGRSVIGLLSIQSYTAQAYNEQSLATLQALADHCGGALERIRTEESLRNRQKMANLISSLSTTFINLAPAETDAAVTNALKIIGTFLGADFCGIESLSPKSGKLQNTHLWCAKGLPGFSLHPESGPSWDSLPWWMDKLRRLESIVLPRLTALPPEAAPEKEFLLTLKAQSLLAVPLARGGALLGFLALGAVRCELPWSAEVLALLKMLGEIVANALEHKRASERVAAFSNLGQRLSAAQTAKHAAQIIVETADQLLGWDACMCDLYSAEEGLLNSLLDMDLINGQRTECASIYDRLPPSPTAKRALEEGGQLILREPTEAVPAAQKTFGDTTRRSASLLFVPIRNGAKVIGVLSIQSYAYHAYDRRSLETLQALADHCGGALERISAEQARRESEERYRNLATNISLGLFRSTPGEQGRFLMASPALVRMFGFESEQELLDRPVASLYVNEADRLQFSDKLQQRGRVNGEEVRLRKKDGTLMWCRITATALGDANRQLEYFDGWVEDITERKKADLQIAAFSALAHSLSAARTAKEAAQTIVDVADQLLGWDACLCELYSPANQGLRLILGMDVIHGRRTEWTSAPNDRPPKALARRAIEEGGQLVLRGPSAQMQPEGVPFGDTGRPSASLLYVPIRHGTKVIGVLSIQSYTHNAYTQQSLETFQALADHCGGALERIWAQEAREQLEAQLRQSQKMEAIGQLAGGVAHDFNNLLAVIRGNAELVAMDADALPAEQHDCLQQIVGASDRAANLTRQLLAFSRKQLMQPQPLHLNEVLGNLSKMLKRIIGEDVDLQCHYAAPSPRVLADVGMLEQVVLNLVVNARDAMPNGGHLRLVTETQAFTGLPDPNHPQARAGEFACLTVQDTGTGIAPEHLSRIFEPFFTTKQLGKGTGLGLATVYGIVQQHQGWVEVSSQVGVGTTFKVFLPALAAAVEAPPVEAPPPPTPRGCETILLVEDDPTVRGLTRRILSGSGYQVQEAASGREALELWSRQEVHIDLLLTDMIMPEGVSGRALAEQLLAQRPKLKVIFMSGYSGDALVQDLSFLQRTNCRFLQKPCSARTLLQAVRQRLDEN